MSKDLLNHYREFLKDYIRIKIDFSRTDQNLGIPAPPIEKPAAPEKEIINLPGKDSWSQTGSIPLISAIENRKSRRKFKKDPLMLEELSFLLWATQGIRHYVNSGTAYRTVPSAGCRHAFETYLCIFNISGLDRGIYRYLPVEHGLVLEKKETYLSRLLVDAAFGQSFLGNSAVTFVWSVIPYRMEWRYGLAAHRVIAIDAGHVCQNLYLACEAVGAGTCAIAAFNQAEMDRLMGVDGEEEFVFYIAPVGKV